VSGGKEVAAKAQRRRAENAQCNGLSHQAQTRRKKQKAGSILQSDQHKHKQPKKNLQSRALCGGSEKREFTRSNLGAEKSRKREDRET